MFNRETVTYSDFDVLSYENPSELKKNFYIKNQLTVVEVSQICNIKFFHKAKSNSDLLQKLFIVIDIIINYAPKNFKPNSFLSNLGTNYSGSGDNSIVINDSNFLDNVSYVIAFYFKKHKKEKTNKTLEDFFNFFCLMDSENYYKIIKQNTFNVRKPAKEHDFDFDFVIIDEEKKERDSFRIPFDFGQVENKKQCFYDDLRFLKNYFSNIKKVVLMLPTEIDRIEPLFYHYIFNIYNIPWLFSNLLEIEIDFSGFKRIIKNDKYFYLILGILEYIASLYTMFLKKLNFFFPYSFFQELDNFLVKNKVKNEYEVFHLFQMFDFPFPNLKSFSFLFNCVDNLSFRGLNSFLKKNPQVVSLDVVFFPKERQEVLFSEKNLLMYLKSIKKFYDEEYHEIQDREDIMNELVKYSKNEIQAFSNILSQQKDSLRHLGLTFNFPDIIFDYDKYKELFIEFATEILLFANTGKHLINNLEIIADNLILDGRKNLNIINKIAQVKEWNSNLNSIKLTFKVFNFECLVYLFPPGIKYIELGELNNTTYREFLKDIYQLLSLEMISFTLWDINFCSEDNFELLKTTFSGEGFPSKLKQVKIISKLYLHFEEIKILAKSFTNKNFVQIWEVEFSSKYISDLSLYKIISDGKKEKIQKMNQEIQELLNENNKNFKSLVHMSYLKRESIIKLLMKIKIIRGEEKEDETRAIIRSIFRYLLIEKQKQVTIKIVDI